MGLCAGVPFELVSAYIDVVSELLVFDFDNAVKICPPKHEIRVLFIYFMTCHVHRKVARQRTLFRLLIVRA